MPTPAWQTPAPRTYASASSERPAPSENQHRSHPAVSAAVARCCPGPARFHTAGRSPSAPAPTFPAGENLASQTDHLAATPAPPHTPRLPAQPPSACPRTSGSHSPSQPPPAPDCPDRVPAPLSAAWQRPHACPSPPACAIHSAHAPNAVAAATPHKRKSAHHSGPPPSPGPRVRSLPRCCPCPQAGAQSCTPARPASRRL